MWPVLRREVRVKRWGRVLTNGLDTLRSYNYLDMQMKAGELQLLLQTSGEPCWVSHSPALTPVVTTTSTGLAQGNGLHLPGPLEPASGASEKAEHQA